MAVERHLEAITQRISTIESKVSKMGEAVIEHRTNLANGQRAFSSQGGRIDDIERKIEPVPISAQRIVGITLTVFLALAGGLWALANMLRDRPTVGQMEKVLKSHEKHGHSSMRDEVRAVQFEQAGQRELIENFKEEQKSQGEKIDSLVEVIVGKAVSPDGETRKTRRKSNR